MKKILAVIVLVIVIILGISYLIKPQAENPIPTETIHTDGPAILGLNEAYRVGDATVTAWAVTQDSRCASDVQCIWAGKVVVALRVISQSGTSSILEIEPGMTKTAENLSITLNGVSPYPISTHKIGDEEYRFDFTFKSLVIR